MSKLFTLSHFTVANAKINSRKKYKTSFQSIMKVIMFLAVLLIFGNGQAQNKKNSPSARKSKIHKKSFVAHKPPVKGKPVAKFQKETVFPIAAEQEIENEENDMYDGPGEAALFEYNRTKDPATGRVPRERLMVAIEEAVMSKNAARRSPSTTGTSNLLGSWAERGPNSDVPGPSNGNTRANSGLASGRVRAIMVDSNDATGKTVFIGSVAGGLWKTTDITASPATWTLVNDFLSNLAIAAICQDPRPGFRNIMYFCTGESYFNVDAVQGNGVFKSTDGGATWNYLASSSSFVNGTRILCDFQGNVYLGTRGSGLRRSTDGGATWSADLTPTGLPSSICDMEISSTGVAGRLHIVTGIFSTQGYRYTDIPTTVASATWTAPNTPFPSFAMRAEIGCLKDGAILYALPADASYQVPTIYRSADGGANWGAVTAPNANWASQQGWYNLEVGVNPTNGNELIIGALDTWKSTNGGASWTQLSTWVGSTPGNQYVHADVHKIIWYDRGNKIVIGSDGGIFYSSDNGATIRDRNQGLRIKQFYSCAIHPTTTNYFLAGAQDNGVHQFSNAGLSSTVEVTGGDGAFVAIDQNQPQFQFGSYVFNAYRRSTDGGASWSGITLNSGTGQFINPFDYDNTANIMYCGDAANSYRRWTDPQTGSTSAVVSISNMTGSVTAVSVSPYTANRVYFGTNGGKIVQVDGANTIASGSAGTDRSTGLPAGTVSCINQGSSDNNLIIVFSNYGINNVWISTNGGATWTASDGNLPDMPVRWAMFYPLDNTKAIIATETGIWETTFLNGASTVWVASPTFPTVRTDMLKYRAIDGTIVAATHGRGLWTSFLASTTTPDILFQQPSDAQAETTVSTNSCRGYKDYTYNMLIANPPTGTATVTLGVVNGGTATQNVDYELLNTTLTFPDGSNASQPFTVRIYDDAAKESAETFTLNYTISGTTNAQAGTSNQTFVLTINDNDAAPIAASSLSGTIGTFNVNLSMPFRGSHFDARTQLLYSASELTALGFTAGNITSIGFNVTSKTSTSPYNGFTVRLKNTSTSGLTIGLAFEGGGTQVYSQNYSTVAGMNTLPITPFAWDGVSNLLVDLCFDNSIAVGQDLVAGTTANANCVFDRQSTNSIAGCSIATSAFGFSGGARPLITLALSVTGTPVSTALNNTKTAYLGPNDDVYFYDGAGAIMARIKNNTAFDYGCTQVTIDRSGTTTAQFWNSNTPNYLASKSIKVVPTNNNPSGNYDLSLYYTNSEVTGFEAAATPTTFSSSKLVKVSNGFFVPDVTAATTHVNDVLIVSGTATALGTNSVMTGNFSSTGFSGFGVGIPGCPSVPFTSDTTAAVCNKFTWNGTEYKVSGDYVWHTTTASGCDSARTLHLTILSVTSTTSKTDATCFGTATGSITVTPTYGVTPFTYRIGTVAGYVSTNTFNNLKAGKYTVSILDANGCAGITSQVTITQPVAVTGTFTKTNVTTCYGGNNGTITVTPTTGFAPYTFKLGTTGSYAASNVFNNLKAGTYTVYIQDANSCVGKIVVTITQPTKLSATFTKTDETCPNAKNGSVTVSPTGGTPPYSYRFGGSGAFTPTNTFSNLKAGSYRIYVNDAINCSGYSILTTVGLLSPSCSTVTIAGNNFPNETILKGLTVSLTPNPTKGQFTLIAHSSKKDAIQVRVTDVSGKNLYATKGLPEQTIRFGEGFIPGTYLIEVRQGDIVKTLKAIKIK